MRPFIRTVVTAAFLVPPTLLLCVRPAVADMTRLRYAVRQPVESIEKCIGDSLGFIAFAGDFGRAFKLPIAEMDDNRQKLRSGLWRRLGDPPMHYMDKPQLVIPEGSLSEAKLGSRLEAI